MTNATHAFICDVDLCAFDTSKMHHEVSVALARIFDQIKATQFREEMKDFRDGGYDIERHLRARYKLNFETIEPSLLRELDKVDLLYSDTIIAVKTALKRPDTDLWFVTIGVLSTQKFTLKLLRRELERRTGVDISSIHYQALSTVHTARKGWWLAHRWTSRIVMITEAGKPLYYDSATIVDDNPHQYGPLVPSPRLRLFQIRRPFPRFQATDRRDILKIRTLDAALV